MNSRSLPGSAPCRHCGGPVHVTTFNTDGRVTESRPSAGELAPPQSVPLFKHPDNDRALVCPCCDEPDPGLTLDELGRLLRLHWDFETMNDPPHPDSSV